MTSKRLQARHRCLGNIGLALFLTRARWSAYYIDQGEGP